MRFLRDYATAFFVASVVALSISNFTFWIPDNQTFLRLYTDVGSSMKNLTFFWLPDASPASSELSDGSSPSSELPSGSSGSQELPGGSLALPELLHDGTCPSKPPDSRTCRWERPRFFLSTEENADPSSSLRYDFYRESCPTAENIIRKAVRRMYSTRPSVAPALVRLVFHDCFIEGCDASVLLDPDEGIDSEKESPPNQSLKGFDVIDGIKSDLENICPEVVSCADVLVLAAREAVLMAGGPFYPLYTGRKDSPVAFRDIAAYELPSPHGDLSQTLAAFASRGFDARETVSLLGAHGFGIVNCRFFEDRLYNFSGAGQPDPSLDPGFAQELKTRCIPRSTSTATSASPSPCPCSGPPSSAFPTSDYSGKSDESSDDRTDKAADISFQEENSAESFGTHYYRRLLQNKGLLYADQQLMAGEETGIWVRAFASDPVLFRREFALSMMKLSNLNVLTGSLGQVRRNCSKVLA